MFLNQNVFEPKCFWTKMFLNQKVFEAKCFLSSYRLFFVRSTYFITNYPKYNIWFCQIYKGFCQIVQKFKTCKTCVLNFRTICVNLSKSYKISPYILGLLVTKYVDLKKNSLHSSHISDMLRLSLGGGVFTNYLSS